MQQFKTALYGFAIRTANYRSFKGPAGQGGATAIEYALIAALIAAVLVGVLTDVGDQIQRIFNQEIIPALGGGEGGEGGG